ncbi:hypothetical protein [Streptomyces sp. NPDC050560]|uniref:hypothetical protein n=1 Tax=Streptomyces sp. NPDC050560 TaxID=3365630 RepID=UPI003789DB79
MNTTADSVAALTERASAGDFGFWYGGIVRLGGCTNPVHLVGSASLVDATTGELLHVYSPEERGGPLLTACGNRPRPGHQTTAQRRTHPPDETDAEVALWGIEPDIARGRWTGPDTGKITLGDFIDRWFRERGYAATSRGRNGGVIRLHIRPYLGELAVAEISTPQVDVEGRFVHIRRAQAEPQSEALETKAPRARRVSARSLPRHRSSRRVSMIPGPTPAAERASRACTSTTGGATTRELMARRGHSTVRAAMIYQHLVGGQDREISDHVEGLIRRSGRGAKGRQGGKAHKGEGGTGKQNKIN